MGKKEVAYWLFCLFVQHKGKNKFYNAMYLRSQLQMANESRSEMQLEGQWKLRKQCDFLAMRQQFAGRTRHIPSFEHGHAPHQSLCFCSFSSTFRELPFCITSRFYTCFLGGGSSCGVLFCYPQKPSLLVLEILCDS